jgi:phage shock protein C
VNRRLTRSRDAMIGGVAAGVANWMNADPALVRIAWALLVPLTAGAALLAYIVGWIVIPEEPKQPASTASVGDTAGDTAGDATPIATAEAQREDDGRAALLIGGGLVLIGLWFLVREYLPDIDWGLVWPLLLVAAGVVILVTASRRR